MTYATESQIALIHQLRGELMMTGAALTTATMEQAGQIIEALQAEKDRRIDAGEMARGGTATGLSREQIKLISTAATSIVAGVYTVNGNDYEVRKPTHGRWKYCTFVSRISGDDREPVSFEESMHVVDTAFSERLIPAELM